MVNSRYFLLVILSRDRVRCRFLSGNRGFRRRDGVKTIVSVFWCLMFSIWLLVAGCWLLVCAWISFGAGFAGLCWESFLD